MIRIATVALMGMAMAASAAHAQDSNMKPSGGKMMSGSSDTSKAQMSDKDTKTMKMCQGMSHDDMMKNKKCMDMMKMHPDMMKTQ